MNTTIRSNNLEVISNGTIFAQENIPIEISLPEFTLKFTLKKDLDNNKLYSKSQIVKNLISIDVFNIENFGGGLYTPVPVFSNQKSTFSLMYDAKALNEITYIITYNILKGQFQ